MAEYTRLQNNFASGYVDPTLHGLTNTEMYGSGLKRCLNFLPSSLGYIYRRPGTHYLGVNLNDNPDCRIHAVKTDLDPVIAVISYHRIDFHSVRGNTITAFMSIMDGVDGNYIPWKAKDISSLDIYEFEGSLYIVHEDYPPCVVRSIDRGLSQISVDEVKGTASYEAPVTTNEYTLSQVYGPMGLVCEKVEFVQGGLETFDKPYHYPSCQTFKGGRWFLSGMKDDPATVYGSKAPDVDGSYRFNDFGVGSYYLVHVHTSMTKTTIYTTNESAGDIESVSYDSSDSETKAEQQTGTEQIEVPEATSGTEYRRWTNREGTSPTTDPASTKRLDVITTADTWSLKSDIQMDDAIQLSESDMYGSRVNWMITQQRVIAGTSRSIWMDNGSAATPADFDMVKTLGTTTSRVKPVMYSSMIIFVPADLKSVKAFYYDNNAGGYQLVDLSATARSLFRESEVQDIAIVEGQEPILWVLLKNHSLLSCTLGAAYGWAEHEIGGGGEVLTMYPYQAETGAGSLFMVISRNGRTTLERLELEDLVNTDVFTLCDSAISLSSSGGTIDFTNNEAFKEGDIVQIVAGGWPRLPFSFEKAPVDVGPGSMAGIYVGYPYRSEVTMLWQELPTNASQSSLSFFRKATAMALQVYRSAGAECGWYSGDRKHLDPFQRLVKNLSDNVEPTFADYYTGIVKLSVPSNTSEMVNATVECNQPLPMTIQAIETRYIIQEA